MRPLHKYEMIVGDKYKVGGGQIQSQEGGQIRYGDWDKSDIKGFGQLVLTALQVSKAAERRLLILVRMGFRMIHVRMIQCENDPI